MANGLLGKKVVNSRDTELVYTVPSARIATMNINVLNNGSESGNVYLYVSDKEYQSNDFEDYLSATRYVNEWVDADTDNTLDLIGKTTDRMVTALKTTPVYAASNTASTPITPVQIKVSQDGASTVSGTISTNFIDIDRMATKGNPLPFYSGTELYIRRPDNGDVQTIEQYTPAIGATYAATTSASNFGMTATDNILWATNVEGSFAMAYVQGVPGSSGSLVNSIADYRSTAAAYNTSFTWGLGAINKICGVKTNEERFIIGTTTGFSYVSNDDTPETQAEFQSNTINPPTGISGALIGAVGIEGATAGEGNLILVYSNSDRANGGKVAYAAYDATTPLPLTGYTTYDFPAGVNAEDIIDVRAEGSALVLVTKTGYKHSSTDLGITWTGSKFYASMPIGVRVAQVTQADGSTPNKFVDSQLLTQTPEWTFVRGRTYRLHQEEATNSGHPLLFSTTEAGPHSSGTPYETGMTFCVGNPTATSDFAQTVTTAADYETHFEDGTYANQPKIIEWTVPSDAPDTLYVYCPNHSGMGWAVSVVDEEATAPHDDQTQLAHLSIWNTANGDESRRYDLFFNGELYMREKRFFELPEVDLYDKAGLGAGALLERTGVMASAGEQVIVKTDGEGVVVRVHGIEEGIE